MKCHKCTTRVTMTRCAPKTSEISFAHFSMWLRVNHEMIFNDSKLAKKNLNRMDVAIHKCIYACCKFTELTWTWTCTSRPTVPVDIAIGIRFRIVFKMKWIVMPVVNNLGEYPFYLITVYVELPQSAALVISMRMISIQTLCPTDACHFLSHSYLTWFASVELSLDLLSWL